MTQEKDYKYMSVFKFQQPSVNVNEKQLSPSQHYCHGSFLRSLPERDANQSKPAWEHIYCLALETQLFHSCGVAVQRFGICKIYFNSSVMHSIGLT